jgi:hypothetical protein
MFLWFEYFFSTFISNLISSSSSCNTTYNTSFQSDGNMVYFVIKIMKIMAYVQYKRYASLSRSSEIKSEFESNVFLVHIICCA